MLPANPVGSRGCRATRRLRLRDTRIPPAGTGGDRCRTALRFAPSRPVAPSESNDFCVNSGLSSGVRSAQAGWDCKNLHTQTLTESGIAADFTGRSTSLRSVSPHLARKVSDS